MSLKYRLAVRPNPTKPEEKRIYAVAVNDGYLTMDQVCKNIERTSTATRGDVKAIALAFSNYLIKSLTEEGNSLFLEDLGFFRIGVTSNGAATEKDFTADLITDKYINYQPKGELKIMKSSIRTWINRDRYLDPPFNIQASSPTLAQFRSARSLPSVPPVMKHKSRPIICKPTKKTLPLFIIL